MMKVLSPLSLRAVVVFGLIASFSSLPANASFVTIDIVARVTGVTAGVSGVSIGDTVSGFYTYDSTAVDQSPGDATLGSYTYDKTPPNGINLQVDGTDIEFKTDCTASFFLIEVDNNRINDDGTEKDAYDICEFNAVTTPGGEKTLIKWGLQDQTATALDSVALPTTAPNLTAWDVNESNIIITSGNSSGTITAEVTSATLGTSKSACCGDGVITPPLEQCDVANIFDNECNAFCRLDDGVDGVNIGGSGSGSGDDDRRLRG